MMPIGLAPSNEPPSTETLNSSSALTTTAIFFIFERLDWLIGVIVLLFGAQEERTNNIDITKVKYLNLCLAIPLS